MGLFLYIMPKPRRPGRNVFHKRAIRQARFVWSKLPRVCRHARSGFGVLVAAAHQTVCAGGGACADA